MVVQFQIFAFEFFGIGFANKCFVNLGIKNIFNVGFGGSRFERFAHEYDII